jgi:hypothetical protein
MFGNRVQLSKVIADPAEQATKAIASIVKVFRGWRRVVIPLANYLSWRS